ncbi:DUF6134 family protein [Marivirga harenae]|uniref:DUF6134 family protein n=1 Tax=Marivirga harenae TaxID=2010992 RepID=UPI0026E03AA8|nr:DUF6134 family protein [Marivirga harenae]WKV13088.1 hypothetical protein Q3Y49_04505 [Marivirga harenae]
MGRLKVFFVVCFLSILGCNLYAQELVYDVSIQGKPVGNMLVTKKLLDSGKVYYSAVMDLEYKLFRPTQMVQLMEAIYQNDTLIQAYFVDKRNNEIVEEAKIEKLHERKYYRTTVDTVRDWHEKAVLKSTLKLYFTPPDKRDSVFSENNHKYQKIAKLPEENRFMMMNNEGEKTIISYNEKGICTQREFNIGSVEYSLKLSEREE